MADNDDIMDADPDQGDVARSVQDAIDLIEDIASSGFGGEWTHWHQVATENAVRELTPEQRKEVWERLLEEYNSYNDDDCGCIVLGEVRGVKKALFGNDAKVTIS